MKNLNLIPTVKAPLLPQIARRFLAALLIGASACPLHAGQTPLTTSTATIQATQIPN